MSKTSILPLTRGVTTTVLDFGPLVPESAQTDQQPGRIPTTMDGVTMARKASPIEAFEDNMVDADHLVTLAEVLTNQRARRMRVELRERVGAALRVRQADRDSLDCLRSADVFVTFLPGSRLGREDFLDQRPLLRQAIVAGCAATETYLADKVMTRIGSLVTSADAATPRMRGLPMEVADWLHIEDRYQRRRRGLRERVIRPYVRQQASTAPSKVGALLSLVGIESWARQLDRARGVKAGSTVAFLDRVTERRNRIAHEGDRQGYGRARLSAAEVRDDLVNLRSVVGGIETLFQ